MLTRNFTRWMLTALLLGAGSRAAQSLAVVAPATDMQQRAWEAVVRRWNLSPSTSVAGSFKILRAGPSLPPNAQLRAVSARAAGREMWLIRLDCERLADCLPFYAVLRQNTGQPLLLVEPLDFGRGRSGQHLERQRRIIAPLQRTGDRVEVIEDVSGIHLKTRAVCLEPGSMGQQIRVRNLVTHRILLATVSGQNRVTVER